MNFAKSTSFILSITFRSPSGTRTSPVKADHISDG